MSNNNKPPPMPNPKQMLFIHIEFDNDSGNIGYQSNVQSLVMFKGMLSMVDSVHTKRNEQPTTASPIVVVKPLV